MNSFHAIRSAANIGTWTAKRSSLVNIATAMFPRDSHFSPQAQNFRNKHRHKRSPHDI